MFKKLIMVLILSGCVSAYAHTGLKSSDPSHHAVLSVAPEVIKLEFNGEVRLIKVAVVNQATGEEQLFKFSPSEGAKARYVIDPDLGDVPAIFNVEWMALGKDMHKVKGQFEFSVK